MEPVSESLKALLALGWTVEHAEVDVPLSHRGSTRRQSKPNVVRFSFSINQIKKVSNFREPTQFGIYFWILNLSDEKSISNKEIVQ